jgi:hypothetical protein
MKVYEFAEIFRVAAETKPLTEEMAKKIAEHVAKLLRIKLYAADEMGAFWNQDEPRVGYYNIDEGEFGVVVANDDLNSVESQESVPKFIEYVISKLT